MSHPTITASARSPWSVLERQTSALFACVTLAASYVLIWTIRKYYGGLDDDAQLYAFQAIARLNPGLATTDLFLKFGSQDNYTIFTGVFAWFIKHLGLASAAALLTIISHAWSAIATWFIANHLTSRKYAWLITGIVLVVPGEYGAFGVFQYSETFFTARLPAEALTLTAIALALASRFGLALLVAALALLTHPLMAMPGLLVLLLYRFPFLLGPRYLLLGCVAFAAIIAVAKFFPHPPIVMMDSEWLAMVRARSFFMFADEWRAVDWDLSLLAFLTILFAIASTGSLTIRRLGLSSIAVGVTGLALTTISSFAAPVALLIQGQPWRWTWICAYLAVAMLPIAVISCWQSRDTARRAIALLLCTAWIPTVSWASSIPIGSPLAALCILLIWQRQRLDAQYVKYLVAFSLCVAATMLASVLASALTLAQLEFTTNKEPLLIERIRDVIDLTLPAVALTWALWFATVQSRRLLSTLFTCMITIALFAPIAPRAYRNWTIQAYETGYAAFTDWRRALDHKRSVFWPDDTPAVWLLLDSPAYLSTSQSAGIVFSRQTASEVARRAAVLEPVTGHKGFAFDKENHDKIGTLTIQSLKAICSDPELGYVVSQRDLPLPHLQGPPGRWGGQRLYFCDSLTNNAP